MLLFNQDNKPFQISLSLSFGVHLLVWAVLTFTSVQYLRKPFKKIEVTYYQTKAEKKTTSAEKEESLKSITEKKLLPKAKISKKNNLGSDSFLKDMSKLPGILPLPKKEPSRISKLHVERKISVPEIKPEKISNPVYLSYYQIVRNRIKDRAYENYSKLDTGQVYLTFVLTSEGTLRQIKTIESKSQANKYLRDIGLKSIQDASPFPTFPKDLRYPELTFNVVISFELQD